MVWWIGGSNEIAEAIAQIPRNSDRAVAIIAAAILERHITAAIKRRWRTAPNTSSSMLATEGPLGNFGPKVDLVYLMGLISAEAHADLKAIKKIRNKFAHYLDVDDFESQAIKSLSQNLTHFENFVLKDDERSGPNPPRKLFYVVGTDAYIQTAKGRYITAVQVYSMIFGPDWDGVYLPPVNIPTSIY
jgi:DNA-binding MltR family transcriptional regulator